MEKVIQALKKIDNNTSAQFRSSLLEAINEGADPLIVDFEETAYISSAGLRVLLEMQKMLKKDGRQMLLRNVRPVVMEVFDITGFSGFLNFEEN